MTTALQFPSTLFKTKKQMNDCSVSDMRYGDLTAAQLKEQIIRDNSQENSTRLLLQK